MRSCAGVVIILSLIAGLSAACGCSQTKSEPVVAERQAATPAAAAQPQAPAARARVFIIGDSISMGYTPIVREMLQDVADVQRPRANCADTTNGLKNLRAWLGETKWDVIHFNWGLHDLCYRGVGPDGKPTRDKEHGKQMDPPEVYEKNLEALVAELEKTGATLIWASTTVVPENETGRVVGDDVKYNAIAARIMKRHKIAIDDLYAVSKRMPPEMFAGPGNVHYTKEGYRRLAESVAKSIRGALARKK